MKRGQQRLVDYLEHILDAIGRIDRYTAGMEEVRFLKDQLVQDAVIRNVEIVGEASNNIQKHFPGFAVAHPDLPLAFAYQMRNAIAHGYFEVDFEIVWKTVVRDLPGLQIRIRQARTAILDQDVEGMDS